MYKLVLTSNKKLNGKCVMFYLVEQLFFMNKFYFFKMQKASLSRRKKSLGGKKEKQKNYPAKKN